MCVEAEDLVKCQAKEFGQNEKVVIQDRVDETQYQDNGGRKTVKNKIREIQKEGWTRLSNNGMQIE